MGTPGDCLGGTLHSGDSNAPHPLFQTYQKSWGVVAVFKCAIETKVEVGGLNTRLERFTQCGRDVVASAVNMGGSITTSSCSEDNGARLLWDLFGLPTAASAEPSRKRRRTTKSLALIKITVPVTAEARAASDTEHIGRCLGHRNSVICNVARLIVRFSLSLPKAAAPIKVTLVGDIAMANSQPFSTCYYPPCYHRALAVFYPAACSRWDPRLSFSLVAVSDVITLYGKNGMAAHFAARALIRAAVLVYADVDGKRVLLIPDNVAQVIKVRAKLVGAADIFAIHKLFTTLPTRFYVDHRDRLQHASANMAMVYDDETNACTSHWIRTIQPQTPLVGLKPSDDIPPWKWPGDTWFCTKAIARTFGKVYSLMHRARAMYP